MVKLVYLSLSSIWIETISDYFFGNFLLCIFLCMAQSTVDKLIKKTNLALVVGTNSWRDQFMEAITVSAGTRF